MSSKREMKTVVGLATARGFAIGPVFIYRGDGRLPIPEYVIDSGREEDEVMRLRHALVDTRRDLENLISVLRERSCSEEVRVFECHQMLIEDEILINEMETNIRERKVNAESAVNRAMASARAMFERMNDAYFRERVRDFDDVCRRLLKHLLGFASNPHLELKSPSIVIANDLTPSETIQLPREYVLGFATDGGSTTSHVALLARAMGIPAVTGLGDVTSLVTAGETVLLDGTAGSLTISPNAAAIRDFRDLVERQKEISEEALTGNPPGTLKGGGRVLLYANLHPGAPFDGVRELGASGVGLYRSEYLWLNEQSEPSEDHQAEVYREVAEFSRKLSADGSATIRMLDIGGDKLVQGISNLSRLHRSESNPFLGNRSIRYLLSHRDMMLVQLRAILRASAAGAVKLLYPMVSCVDELREAQGVLAEAKRSLDREGVRYDKSMPVGAMIEVPSAAINASAIARYVDFFSIGTNDLIQYTMAADRGNEAVAHLYQPLNPAVMSLMRIVIAAAKEKGISVSVCGESASDPIVAVVWAAMGVDELSMSATYIPVISKMLSRLTRKDLDECRGFLESIDGDNSANEIYERCRAWITDKIPDIDNIII